MYFLLFLFLFLNIEDYTGCVHFNHMPSNVFVTGTLDPTPHTCRQACMLASYRYPFLYIYIYIINIFYLLLFNLMRLLSRLIFNYTFVNTSNCVCSNSPPTTVSTDFSCNMKCILGGDDAMSCGGLLYMNAYQSFHGNP